MKEIILITDHKGNFGTKHNATPYRCGMDKSLLEKYFRENEYDCTFLKCSEIDFRKNWKDKIVLYTSREDKNQYYKNYIEDVVYGLELAGANVIPKYKYLRANNNKVFMEILRDELDNKDIKNIRSYHFGSIEELEEKIDNIQLPAVIKPAFGAIGKGVGLAHTKSELLEKAMIISRSRNLYNEFKEIVRSIRYQGYKKDSKFRNKFIVQNFITGLSNDWKVLKYNKKCFALYRGNRKGDFRASGSGTFDFKQEVPEDILDFACKVQKIFAVPNISLDIGFTGGECYLIEFQFVYFGTTTIEKAPFHFQKEDNKWNIINSYTNLEKEYVDSIVKYIGKHENTLR